MNQNTPPRPDIRQTIGSAVLEEIGAIALYYNSAEFLIDTLLYTGLSLNGNIWFDVVTRINGYDGKVAICKKVAESFRFPRDVELLIKKSLDTFLLLKQHRDRVIHAFQVDQQTGKAHTKKNKGGTKTVVVAQSSLAPIREHLVVLLDELSDCMALFDLYRTTKIAISHRSISSNTPIHGEEAQDFSARLLAHQKERESIPPLPELL